MIQRLALLFLLLGLPLSSCENAKEIKDEDWQKLSLIAEIASEIEHTYKIECYPYSKNERFGQIELHVSDPELDHQPIATEILKLNSIQSFDGALYLVFRHPKGGSAAPTMWIKYDAKTVKQTVPEE